MGLLLFKKIFAEAILAGTKTTTLRHWSRARCKPGQKVFAPGIGYLRVTTVDQVRLMDLTEADANADGFANMRLLKKTLKDLYGPKPAGKSLYRVRFHWLSPPVKKRLAS